MYRSLVNFIRDFYSTNDPISLHEPFFDDVEKDCLARVIDSGFVSSVGQEVTDFENQIALFTNSRYAIATMNGTSALHMALILSGVQENNEVLTQSLSFVATSNAISYCQAKPVFIDVDLESLSFSADSFASFIDEFGDLRNDGLCWNKSTNRIIRACLPMHTFGLAADIERIKDICDSNNIILVEDAAESLGTTFNNRHTGTNGAFGILSFNGNKIITTGGGGMILTNHEEHAIRVRHLTTTAKKDHKWLFSHDAVGYNYRMPNINAALGIAQLKKLPLFLDKKRFLASSYQKWGEENNIRFAKEVPNSLSNYWLNTIIAENQEQRDLLLSETNSQSIMTRPAWTPMHELAFNKHYQTGDLKNTNWLYKRIVNLPSSPKMDG
jgi:aminotransferase in exopolysaccharide biosynthesis